MSEREALFDHARRASIRQLVTRWISEPDAPDLPHYMHTIPASPDDVFWLLDVIEAMEGLLIEADSAISHQFLSWVVAARPSRDGSPHREAQNGERQMSEKDPLEGLPEDLAHGRMLAAQQEAERLREALESLAQAIAEVLGQTIHFESDDDA